MSKLSEKSRKEILNSLSLVQLKKLAKECGIKPPYKTIFGRPWIKHDFVSFLQSEPKFWRKQALIKLIRKKATLPTGMKRDLERERGSKCEACGKRFKGGLKPHIHHIKPIEDGGSSKESNLIILCPNCHTMAHSGTYSKSELRNFIKK